MPVVKPASQFLPTSATDLQARGWAQIDVLLVTGDAYVDHPAFGAAMIGRILEADGWRVGIVAQPDWRNAEALKVMGRPRLFCGITAGNLDSMVSNYTAARHRRQEDAYSEGGLPGRRPNHAAVVYAQLCREAFPGIPVVLGGIEASLRRVGHYDYWEDKLRPSILASAKADLLVYGMGETQAREIARRLDAGQDLAGIRGTARLLGAKAAAATDFTDCLKLPDWDRLRHDPQLLLPLTRTVEKEQSPYNGRRMVQFHGDRAVLIESPAFPLDQAALDALYELPFARRPHPSYRERIPAFTMIKDSITVQRGCPGGCTFCAIGLHQGKFLTSRSEDSVLKEIRRLTETPEFRGTISDLGGPTANLYASENGVDPACHSCRRVSCLHPTICSKLALDEDRTINLMRAARETPGVKHVFIQSGIRMDVALRTPGYVRELVRHHVSGHLKVAPEHLHPDVLRRMRKPAGVFEKFQEEFRTESRAANKEQYLVPYFISSFPGCTNDEMGAVERYLREANWNLQQVQDFIPLPMTPSAAMYVTGLDFDTGKPIPVVRNAGERRQQMQAFRPNPKGRSRKPQRQPSAPLDCV
ncbi:MAG: YgiQ family radical SAM protein [Verrucomicrobiales bacterium]|nr:YgiQ family radical SAM protein [Verrucomicrobiales bacterium]